MAEAASAEVKSELRPIVPYLILPEGQLEGAYLQGLQCKGCGQSFLYAPTRRACAVCAGHAADQFSKVRLSDRGEVWVYTIVYQSWPGIPTPFVGAIVDVPVEGQPDRTVAVRANISGVEPDPKNVKVGMKVRMRVAAVHKDAQGNDVVAFHYIPAK